MSERPENSVQVEDSQISLEKKLVNTYQALLDFGKAIEAADMDPDSFCYLKLADVAAALEEEPKPLLDKALKSIGTWEPTLVKRRIILANARHGHFEMLNDALNYPAKWGQDGEEAVWYVEAAEIMQEKGLDPALAYKNALHFARNRKEKYAVDKMHHGVKDLSVIAVSLVRTGRDAKPIFDKLFKKIDKKNLGGLEYRIAAEAFAVVGDFDRALILAQQDQYPLFPGDETETKVLQYMAQFQLEEGNEAAAEKTLAEVKARKQKSMEILRERIGHEIENSEAAPVEEITEESLIAEYEQLTANLKSLEDKKPDDFELFWNGTGILIDMEDVVTSLVDIKSFEKARELILRIKTTSIAQGPSISELYAKLARQEYEYGLKKSEITDLSQEDLTLFFSSSNEKASEAVRYFKLA